MRSFTISLFALALTAGNSIAGEYRAYASVKGWDIVQGDLGCVADHPSRGDIQWSILVSPAGNWEVRFDDLAGHPDNSDFPVRIIAGDESFTEEYFTHQGAYIGVLPLDQRLALAKGSDVSIQLDGMELKYSLTGSTAALLKLEECWHQLTGYDPNISSRRGAYAFK